jgi:quercetin dioxygenase-like cupin family protein
MGVALVNVTEHTGPPLHVHEREDETFIVLEGRFEFQIRDERFEVGRGDTVFGPRGVPHTFRALEGGGRMCVAFSPGGFEDYFPACEPLFASGAPDMNELVRLSADFGLTFLGAYNANIEAQLQPTLSPRVVRADEGERMGPPGEHGRGVLSPLESGGILLGEVEVDLGAGPPPHVHTREDEVFFVSEGRFEMWTGDSRTEVGPGTLIYGPRDVPHAWRAIEEGSTVWVWITPGANFEAFFRALTAMTASGPPDPVALSRLGSEYGLVMLGSPESVWL